MKSNCMILMGTALNIGPEPPGALVLLAAAAVTADATPRGKPTGTRGRRAHPPISNSSSGSPDRAPSYGTDDRPPNPPLWELDTYPRERARATAHLRGFGFVLSSSEHGLCSGSTQCLQQPRLQLAHSHIPQGSLEMQVTPS